MLLFEDYNFAYLHINKTGGSTVKVYLRDVLGGPEELIGLGTRPSGLPRIHEPLIFKKKKLGDRFYGLKFLTTIRNPYDRWLSLYTAGIRNIKEGKKNVGDIRCILAAKLSFDVWLGDYILDKFKDNLQNLPQTNFLFIEDFYVSAPFIPNNLHIIRLEDLKDSLPKFLEEELGVQTGLKIPHKNKSSHVREKKDTMDYYPDDLRKKVYQLDRYIIDKYYPDYKYKG